MIDSQTLVPLEKIIFRDRPVLKTSYRLCPCCLRYNETPEKTCKSCNEEIPDYTAQDFLRYRINSLNKNLKKEPTMGLAAIPQDGPDLEKQFHEQYAKWAVQYEEGLFLRRTMLKVLELEDFGLLFLRSFPLQPGQLRQIEQFSQNAFTDENYQSSVVAKKLLAIRTGDPTQTYNDVAFFLENYTDEIERASMSANLFYLNVRYAYWLSPQKQVLQLDESNPVHQNEVMPYVARTFPTFYELEVVLCPIHWKYLAEDKFHPIRKFRISKWRYRYLLEQWHPITEPDLAWKNLANEYAKDKPDANPIVEAYRDLQLSRPINDRDQNFLFSYMLIYDDYRDEILDFPWKLDSYYTPLIGFQKDPQFIPSFFLEKANPEALMRGLFYYDFSRFPDQKALCERIFKTFTKKQLLENRKYYHPSLFALMAGYAIEGEHFELGIELLRGEVEWPPLLKELNLLALFQKNPETVEKIADMIVTFKNFPVEILQNFLTHASKNKKLVTTISQALRRFENPKRFFPMLFDLWLQLEREEQDHAKEVLMLLKPYLGGHSVQLEKDFLEKLMGPEMATAWIPKFRDLFISLSLKDQLAMDRLISFLIETRVLTTELFEDPSYRQPLVDSIASLLEQNRFTNSGRMAEVFALKLAEANNLSDEQAQKLWKVINRPDDRYYATKMSMTITPPIKKILDAEKALANAAKAAIEAEKKQKQDQERQAREDEQRKVADAQQLVIQRQQARVADYQKTVAEVQAWYQGQVALLMAGTDDAALKAVKISALAAEMQAKMAAAAALMQMP